MVFDAESFGISSNISGDDQFPNFIPGEMHKVWEFLILEVM